ncbi:MAG: hypothetical protein A2Z34_00815 [Planctomycetes bacterium RBG_16_59_8]|nr:MAG: hypothetical protein A2Z34_00815 [Planctomycetes bacterium RBG_16_59_8]
MTEEGEQRTIPLEKPSLTVGRSRSCDVRIRTENASREHFKVIKTEKGYTAVDLDSRNGTFVNGEKIGEKRLAANDVITVGKCRFLFTDRPPDEKAPPPDASPSSSPTDGVTASLNDPRVNLLLETIIAAVKVQELDPFLNIVVDNIIAITKAERGILLLHDKGSGSLTIHVARDNQGSAVKNVSDFSRSIPQKAIATRKAIFQMDIGTDESDLPTPSMKFYQLRTVMCAPLCVGETLLGALYVDSRASVKEFAETDLAIFEAVSNNISLAIENVRARDELQRRNEGIRRALEEENKWLRSSFAKQSQIIGECREMKAVYETIRKVATTDATVTIFGESGTGKEAIAHVIHDLSGRSGKPFVVVDCASIPENLLESELFGHEKGAFTGAESQKKGKFERADGGTLFLDEIAELPVGLQVKLLRAIETGELNVVGAEKAVRVDVRIIAATNQNIEKLVAESKFRHDLYHRLNVISLNVPPLRNRGEDIVLLARHFLHLANTQNDRSVRGLTSEAEESIAKHPWPGNVRELKHKIEQAVILSGNEYLTSEDLGLAARKEKIASLEEARDEFEKQHVVNALAQSKYNVTRAAEILGITRQHLQNLMKKHQIEKPGTRN